LVMWVQALEGGGGDSKIAKLDTVRSYRTTDTFLEKDIIQKIYNLQTRVVKCNALGANACVGTQEKWELTVGIDGSGVKLNRPHFRETKDILQEGCYEREAKF